MDQYRSDALPDELICRVQNLLPDVCLVCKETYCVKLTDKPIASCVRCGQGCHDVCFLQAMGKTKEELDESNNFGVSILNPFAPLGLYYICGHCKDEVIPSKDHLKIKKKGIPANLQAAAQHQSRESTTNAAPSGTVNQSALQQDEAASDTSQDGQQDAHHEQLTDRGPPPPPEEALSQQRIARQNNSQPPANHQRNDGSEPPVCKFYKQGRCKHGVSGKKEGVCRYRHPKPCRKFLTSGNHQRRGCTLGSQCQFFHPKMCNSSLRERKCYREDCTYMHIKGTIRTDLPHTETTNPPARRREPSGGPEPRQENAHGNGTRHHPEGVSSFLGELKNLSEQMRLIGSKIQQLEANQGLIMQRHMFSYPQASIAQAPPTPMVPYIPRPTVAPAPQYQPNTYIQRAPPPQPSQ